MVSGKGKSLSRKGDVTISPQQHTPFPFAMKILGSDIPLVSQAEVV